MEMLKNPYNYKGPLDPAADLSVCIPRKNRVNKVIDGINKGDYWGIIGPRQVGKTTFLRQIQQDYLHTYYVYINFQSSEPGRDKFYRWIMEEFLKYIPIPSKHKIKETMGYYGPEVTFFHFLENFKPKNTQQKIVLLFDEIERIPDASDFLHLWRKVYHERYHKPSLRRYVVVIAGSAGLIPLTRGPNSPFNIAEVCYMKDFSFEETVELIENPLKMIGIKIEPGVPNKIWSLTSGHPQLLQHLCYLLVDKALEQDRIIKESYLEDAVKIILKENFVLDTLRHHIDVNNILEELLRDILNGEKKLYYPNKEYSVAGAGAIVEQGEYCAVRNEIFHRFIKGILSNRTYKSLSPVGKKLLNLQEKIQQAITGIKDFEEKLVYENDFIILQKFEKDLEQWKSLDGQYKKEYDRQAREAERSDNDLSIDVGNLVEKLSSILKKIAQLLQQKKLLVHYQVEGTVHIVSDVLKMLDIETLQTLEAVIVHADEIDEITIHKVLADAGSFVTRVNDGTILCIHHALAKKIGQVEMSSASLKEVKIKFNLFLPIIPLILINRGEFEAESHTGINIEIELKALGKSWNRLLEKIKPKKS